MHGGVSIGKGPCICAERRAGLHASVLVCRAACLFCTSTCTHAGFTRSLSGQIEPGVTTFGRRWSVPRSIWN